MIAPCVVEHSRDLLRRRRVRVAALERGRFGHRGDVHAEVVPPHGAVKRGPQHEVGLAHRRGRKWPAHVVAGLLRAETVAAAHPGVEPLQQLGVELRRSVGAESRLDVETHQEALVALPGGVGELDDLQPLRHHLREVTELRGCRFPSTCPRSVVSSTTSRRA